MKATTRSRQCFCRSDIEKSMVSPLLLASGGLASHAIRRKSDVLRFSASWPEVGKILKRHPHAKRVMPARRGHLHMRLDLEWTRACAHAARPPQHTFAGRADELE